MEDFALLHDNSEGCLCRRLAAEVEAEKSLSAGLRCEIDELRQSHASQLEQYSEKTRALVRYRIHIFTSLEDWCIRHFTIYCF